MRAYMFESKLQARAHELVGACAHAQESTRERAPCAHALKRTLAQIPRAFMRARVHLRMCLRSYALTRVHAHTFILALAHLLPRGGTSRWRDVALWPRGGTSRYGLPKVLKF